MDYEIVFDGTHGDQDWDLLCTPEIREKRRDVLIPLVLDHGNYRPRKARSRPDAVYGAIESSILAALHHLTLGARELSDVTGFSYEQIKHAMERLRRAGSVTRQFTDRDERQDGAPYVRYSLVERA